MHNDPRSFAPSSATLLALLGAAALASLPSCRELGDGPGEDPSEDSQWRAVADLPSGTECSVEIDPSLEGEVFPANTTNVTVAGTAAVGEVEPPETTVIYVLDMSGSTNDSGGACGTILDCAVAALSNLHTMIAGMPQVVETGCVGFATSAAACDVVPGGGIELFTPPDADINGNTILDMLEVLASAAVGGFGEFTAQGLGSGTDYSAALVELSMLSNNTTTGNPVSVFASDGENLLGDTVATTLAGNPVIGPVHTFAVGAGTTCTSDPLGLGSLMDIAEATGGTCTDVPDPNDLPDVLEEVLIPELTDLTMTVNGNNEPIDSIVPDLPVPGSVIYSRELTGLTPGTYTVCVKALCTEGDDSAAAEECDTFRINAPPKAKCKDVMVSADSMCQAEVDADDVNDGSYDPDGDAFECTLSPSGTFGLGMTDVTLTCTDAHGDSDECTAKVTVVDDTPPEVVLPDEGPELWPPNHTYRPITGDLCIVSVSDNCDGMLDPAAAFAALTVSSDEPESVMGSGNTCVDIDLDPTVVQLRSERIGSGNGRVYTIEFEVTDAAGNATPGTCQVTVPHSQNGAAAVDDGCALCVGAACPAGCAGLDPSCE